MKISLSPQVRDDALTVNKAGDTLTINGAVYDLSVIPDGATLPASATDCPYLIGDIKRENGALSLTLMLPIGPYAQQGACFPAPIIDPPDGPLVLPEPGFDEPETPESEEEPVA